MVETPQGVDPGGGLVMRSVFDVCPPVPDNLRYICQLSASFLPQRLIRAEAAYKAGLYDASHPNRHS